MIYIGIDPGKSGAMAMINTDRDQVMVRPFDADEYQEALELFSVEKCFAVVERVSARPGQGVVSMFNFGENYGYIQGMLKAYHVPHELVRPQAWKRMFAVTKDKATSIAVCKRLFPGVSLKRTQSCRTDSDGMAEALLIAEYARRTWEGRA